MILPRRKCSSALAIGAAFGDNAEVPITLADGRAALHGGADDALRFLVAFFTIMTIAFYCVSCQHLIRVGDQNAGKRGKCPKCGTAMTVPMPVAAPVVSVAPVVPARPAADPNDPFANFAAEGQEPLIRRPYRRRGSKLKLFVIWLIVLALLGGGGYFAYYWYFGASGGISEEERYFPDGVQMVASVRVDEFLSSEAWKAVKKEAKELAEVEKRFGGTEYLKLSEVERVTVAVAVKGERPNYVFLVRSKKDLKADDVVADAKKSFKAIDIPLTEKKIDGQMLYLPEHGQAFCVVSSRLILQGPGDTLQAVLKRGKKPDFGTDFGNIYKEADFSKTLAFAVNVADLASSMKKAGEKGNPLESLPLPPGVPPLPLEMLEGVQGVASDVKVGADVTVRATLLCKDAKTAEALRKLAEDGLKTMKEAMKEQAPKDVVDVLEGVKLTVNGKNLASTVTIKVGPILKSLKELKALGQ